MQASCRHGVAARCGESRAAAPRNSRAKRAGAAAGYRRSPWNPAHCRQAVATAAAHRNDHDHPDPADDANPQATRGDASCRSTAGRAASPSRWPSACSASPPPSASTGAWPTVDIAGSLAHARMLAGAGRPVRRRPRRHRARHWRRSAARSRAASSPGRSTLEDVHLNIEKRLTALVGDAGKRLHTGALAQRPGRHRRAAVAARRDRRARRARSRALRRALLDLAERHADTIMPGFTHLQVAQPVTFGHHLLAYEAMFARDAERLADCRRRVNRLPLGAPRSPARASRSTASAWRASWASTASARNSLDAVSDRDFAIEFAAAAALAMVHLSRFAEELVLWSTPRFGFVTLADRFCTGSSIMPQKKNPDVPELVRGKTGARRRRA